MKKFIIKQLNDIKSFGFKELLRKFYLFFLVLLRISIDFFALFPCIVIRLLAPIVIIRIEKIPAGTYGNFANDPAIYYCKKKLNIDQLNKKHIDLVYISYTVKNYNKQLAKMWKRKLNFLPGYLLEPIDRVNRFFPGWEVHSIQDISCFVPRDLDAKIEKCQPLEFTKEEEIYGRTLLNKFGLKENDKFVCFIIRDGAHNQKYKMLSRGENWTYHDYRHWNIDNFLLAAEELTKRGYYVFRMGKVAEKKFNSNNSKIIDYANSNLKNDFLDVFLGAKCSFCLSTGVGFDEVPHIFRRPIILLSLPFSHFRSHSERFFILTKHHYSKKKKKKLTLSEIFSSGLAFAYGKRLYEKEGVELIDNTPDEIKDIVLEMVEYLERNKKMTLEEEDLQRNFKDLYLKNYHESINNIYKIQKELTKKQSLNLKISHGQIRSRFSSKFLKNNKDWLQ